jgi:uncharacterized protein (TIGR02271 family)
MKNDENKAIAREGDSNPDPITGAPGSHPVATGAGALAGGATGAAIGTAVGGPVGGAVGAAIGAVAGGLGGKAAGEAVDPTVEDAYWREHHHTQPWAEKNTTFEDYHPAYRTGYEGFAAKGGTTKFEEAEPELRTSYESKQPKLPWNKAREATKAAWSRVEHGNTIRVPVNEEKVSVGKREVEAGSVQVHKEVTTETVNVPVDLKREEVVVTRTAASGPAEAAFQEGEIRVPVKREEAVVHKTAEKTGEVTIQKSADVERSNVSETVRKERVDVQKDGDTKIRR